MTKYQQAKQQLKEVSEICKDLYPKDKPLIRMRLNNEADSISRDLDLSEYQKNLLANYVCKLHPKD